jgi:hypothetical protein
MYPSVDMPQKRPTAAHRPVTPAWQASVDAELVRRDWTRKRLAEAIRASPSAITVLMRPETMSSRLVDAVCEALAIPSPDFIDSRDAEVIADLRALRTADPDSFNVEAARIRADLERARSRKR